MKQDNQPLTIGPLLVSERSLERLGWVALLGCILSIFIWPGWFVGAGRGPFSLWVMAVGLSMCCASVGAFRRWLDVSVKERGMVFAGVLFVVMGAIGVLIALAQD